MPHAHGTRESKFRLWALAAPAWLEARAALDGSDHLLRSCAEILEHLRGDALALDRERHQEVSAVDPIPSHPPRLFKSDLDHGFDA